MIISHKYKFLFFCPVGNCATTSIYKALLPLHDEAKVKRIYEFNFDHPLNHDWGVTDEGIYGDALVVSKHIPPKRFFDFGLFKEEDFKNYTKFTIVRNPWDWCLAAFLKRAKEWYESNNLRWDDSIINGDFIFSEDYFNFTLEGIDEGKNFHETQYDTVSKANGECYITDFIKFENLSNDLIKICDKLMMPTLTLGHEQNNHNPAQKKYQNYYTEESRQLVGQRFKKDIEKFNYDF